MKRIRLLPFAVAVVFLAVACGGRNQAAAPTAPPGPAETGTQPGGTAQPTTQSQPLAAGRSALGNAAARVTNVCDLLPLALVRRFIPAASSPVNPLGRKTTCSATDGNAVLEIVIEAHPFVIIDPVQGAEFIPGLAEGGYLERPVPDEADLKVILSRDPRARLLVSLAGHDGKDHKDDVVALARELIARLR